MRVRSTVQKISWMAVVIAVVLAASGWAFADANSTYYPLQASAPSPDGYLAYNSVGNEVAPKPTPSTTVEGNLDPTATCENTCESNCAPRCGHWVVGVEGAFLSPTQSGTSINYQIQPLVGSTATYDASNSTVDGLYLTPRLWLGYQGECWGVVTRYWRMNEGRDEFVPNLTNLNGMTSTSFFKAETFDLEATRLVYWGQTKNLLSGGIRYAELTESQRATVFESFGTPGNLDTFLGSAYSKHQFSGAGLTMALTGLRPINDNPHLNLFYSARGSYLFDDNNAANIVETQSIYYGAGSATATNGAIAGGCDTNMFIGEIQIGAQWNFELVKNRADAFFRLAFEYQYWDTTNTGSAASSSTVITPSYMATSSAMSGDTQVHLVGFSAATGFTW